MSTVRTTSRSAAASPWSRSTAAGLPRAMASVSAHSTTLVCAAILVFGLATRVIVAFTMPAWQSPDEPKHFEYIRVLTDLRVTLWTERRLPGPDDALPKLQRAVIVSLDESHYWESIRQPTPNPLPTRFRNVWPGGTHTQLHRPSLYYFLVAPILLPFTNTDLDTQLRIGRLVSVVLSTLTIWVVYLTARIVVRDDPFIPLVSAAFVAALPMHVYIGASINNDNLIGLFGALICLGLVWGIDRGFSLRTWLLVIGAFVLGLATKRGIVGLAPAVGLAGLFWLPSLRGWRLTLGLAIFSLAGLAGLVVLDALGLGLGLGWLLPDHLRASVARYALNEQDQLTRLLGVGLDTPNLAQIVLGHQTLLFRSFWGVFGWFSVHLTATLYTWLALATGLCALGFLVWLGGRVLALRSASATTARRDVLVGLTCLAAIVTLLVLAEGERLAYFTPAQIPQGRYLFVVIGPVALALARGARTLLPARWLGTWRPVLAIALGLLLLDAHVYVSYLLPFFRTGLPG